MSSTFVITLDEDVAEFLDLKTRGGDARDYILQILRQEKQRQEQQKATSRPSRK